MNDQVPIVRCVRAPQGLPIISNNVSHVAHHMKKNWWQKPTATGPKTWSLASPLAAEFSSPVELFLARHHNVFERRDVQVLTHTCKRA